METISIGGSKYFVQFLDDFSRMSFVYFMKSRDQTFQKFKEFQSLVEKQVGRIIKILLPYNGTE